MMLTNEGRRLQMLSAQLDDALREARDAQNSDTPSEILAALAGLVDASKAHTAAIYDQISSLQDTIELFLTGIEKNLLVPNSLRLEEVRELLQTAQENTQKYVR